MESILEKLKKARGRKLKKNLKKRLSGMPKKVLTQSGIMRVKLKKVLTQTLSGMPFAAFLENLSWGGGRRGRPATAEQMKKKP